MALLSSNTLLTILQIFQTLSTYILIALPFVVLALCLTGCIVTEYEVRDETHWRITKIRIFRGGNALILWAVGEGNGKGMKVVAEDGKGGEDVVGAEGKIL